MLFVLFSFVLISLYLLPAIVAFVRDAPDTGSVMVLNLFFGWTFVGWVVALAMAARSRTDGSVNVLVNPHIQSGYLFPTPPAPAFQHPSQPQFQPQAAPQFLPTPPAQPPYLEPLPQPEPHTTDGT